MHDQYNDLGLAAGSVIFAILVFLVLAALQSYFPHIFMWLTLFWKIIISWLLGIIIAVIFSVRKTSGSKHD